MTELRPGPANHLCDVAGLAVGHAGDAAALTGVTVVLPAARMVAAVDIRGGGPGTRETALLAPGNLVEAIDALVLAGGSVFGLDAAGAVVARLAAAGRGFDVGGARVPIVPAAILYDLANGGTKPWLDGGPAPFRALAEAAFDAAASGGSRALGNVGAGLGAKAGTLKGGLGSASTVDPVTGITVGALAAANPFGGAVQPGSDSVWAWPFELAGELGGQIPPAGPLPAGTDPLPPPTHLPIAGVRSSTPGAADPGANTTLMVVAVDAALDRALLQRVAMMAQDGLARAVRPAHTPFDGDTLFALATGDRPLPEPRAGAVARLGAIAADTLARAVARGVFAAEAIPGFPAYRERHRAGFRHDPAASGA